MNLNKNQILSLLREIVPSAKLPSQMDFEVRDDCLFINVSGSGVVANMQEDKSAFEGWAVVIKSAIPQVDNVILDWVIPEYDPSRESAQIAHYNRFVMRAANFKKGYKWFDVSGHRKQEVAEMQKLIEGKTLIVNYPQSECSSEVDRQKKPEAYLERELVKEWGKPNLTTDEQLPVGLFKGEVSRIKTFTPRGASQIDLWQLGGDTMKIYELKVKGNESIGIISELMFYVVTIQHIVDRRIKYTYLREKDSSRHYGHFIKAVEEGEVKKVEGYFTASKFHPLLETLKDNIQNILTDNTFGIGFDYKYISDIKD